MRKAVLSLKLVTLAVAVVLAGMMPAATCLSARPTLAAASGETQAAAAVGSSVDRFPAAAFASLGPSRRLLRGGSRVLAADMRVSIANFAALPAGLKGVFNIPGIELAGSIQAPAGALGSREATELANILAAEMVRDVHYSPHPHANTAVCNLCQCMIFGAAVRWPMCTWRCERTWQRGNVATWQRATDLPQLAEFKSNSVATSSGYLA